MSSYRLPDSHLMPTAGLGVFVVFNTTAEPNADTGKKNIHHASYGLTKALLDEEKGKISAATNTTGSLSDYERTELILTSIKTLKEQVDRYQPEDYRELITDLVDDGERHKIELGSKLMKNEADIKVPAYCLRLEAALETGLDDFYSAYRLLVDELCESRAKEFDEIPKDTFIELAVQQWKPPTGVTVHPFLTGMLEASWLWIILEAMWQGDLTYSAYKTSVMRRSVPHMILDFSTSRIPEITTGLVNRYELTDTLWLDAQALAGLTPDFVERILAQTNQAYVIDIMKLLISLWTEHPEIQRSRRFNLKGRYQGLAEMLHERYGAAKGGDARSNIVAACHFLNGLRYGTSATNYANLVAIGGLESRGELIFTYLEGFIPVATGERLVPILDHPTGSTRSRAHYNRLGLSIGCFLVEESNTYYRSNGEGVPLNNKRLKYLQEKAGFSKRASLMKGLRAFEDYGAIEINRDALKLGVKNEAGERLIFDGEIKSLNAQKAGRASGRKRRSTSSKK